MNTFMIWRYHGTTSGIIGVFDFFLSLCSTAGGKALELDQSHCYLVPVLIIKGRETEGLERSS